MITRLRPLPSADELARLYPAPHDHRIYGRGHHERVEATISLARSALDLPGRDLGKVADLSCGNGHIVRTLQPVPEFRHLGDLAGAEIYGTLEHGYVGPLEETIHVLPEVDLFVCSETIEHVDDPVTVLSTIRSKAIHLLLSTPLECWDDANDEHLWAWDQQGVEAMLLETRWTPRAFTTVDSREYGEPYLYGIWVCS